MGLPILPLRLRQMGQESSVFILGADLIFVEAPLCASVFTKFVSAAGLR